jgi:sugar lactone lactonase YvrE
LQSKLSTTLVGDNNGLKFAKCPQWANQRLFFLDVHDRCIKSTDMGGSVQTEETLPYLPAAFGILAAGGWLIGDARRRRLFLMEDECEKQVANLAGVARCCLSDAIVATQGAIYVGDVGFDFLDPLVDPVSNGIIVHIEKGGRVSLVAEDLFFPNGMVITPDQRTLIVAETLGHSLTAFDIANNGSLGNRRVWAQLPDDVRPDGICLDGEGAIWAATTSPRALRILEGGQIVDEVIAEQPVFAVALGGPQCRHLFLCTSASADPIITRRTPSAAIELATVNVAGVMIAHDQQPMLRSIVQ